MAHKYRVVVAGVGKRGMHHALAFQANPVFEVTGICDVDPARLEETVNSHNISMCGPGPVMAMITACKELGAKKASLLKYATSGDITGNHNNSVSYVSMVFK